MSKPYVSLVGSMQEIHKQSFLTVKCYTVAIMKENSLYHMFDPHYRNEAGLTCTDGTAVLTTVL